MPDNTKTSLIPSVAREFCLLLLVALFASAPFVAAQAEESPAAMHVSAR